VKTGKVVKTIRIENQEGLHPAHLVVNFDADEPELIADHVIVTSSLGYLKKHARFMFQPPLPQPMLDTIDKLG